jgi:hypothetical protein
VTTPCSVLAERLGEDHAATAPKARRFLLLEQPGPWRGRNAVTHSDLDAGLAHEILAFADQAGVKVHLIRRSARRATLATRACFLADTRRDGPWLQRYELTDPAEVLDLELDGDPQAAWHEPLYAVCTHGKRDPCCARRGRPLARAMKAARPEQTWEIGHIGGHRFAATFLTFPKGFAFGRVPAAAGPRIVAALEAGELDLDHLRGRAGDSPVVQAADVFVRRELALRGVHELTVLDVNGSNVTLRGPKGRIRVGILQHERGPRPISCGDEPEPVPAYGLGDFTLLDEAA